MLNREATHAWKKTRGDLLVSTDPPRQRELPFVEVAVPWRPLVFVAIAAQNFYRPLRRPVPGKRLPSKKTAIEKQRDFLFHEPYLPPGPAASAAEKPMTEEELSDWFNQNIFP